MSKPPQSTPHSDLDGVHRDEKSNVDGAIESGEDGSNLETARSQSTGRPVSSDDQPDRGNRSS